MRGFRLQGGRPCATLQERSCTSVIVKDENDERRLAAVDGGAVM
jgi:hypothetical protein